LSGAAVAASAVDMGIPFGDVLACFLR